MPPWTLTELASIGQSEELEISSLRRDGTFSNPVTIWVVRHGAGLYVRSGGVAAWYRAALARGKGRITVGGTEMNVAFAAADPAFNDGIDEAYSRKYRRHGVKWIKMVTAQVARSTTMALLPRR